MASDRRLSPTDRLVACALLWWAWGDRSTVAMSNKSLAAYVNVSIPTIERSIRSLVKLGYIRTEAVKPTTANLTGRVITLRWVEDPTILPTPPARSAVPKKGERESITSEGGGPSRVMDPVHHERGGGSITGDGPGPSRVMDKEDRYRKKVKNLKNVGTEGESTERQRPQANDGPCDLLAADRPIALPTPEVPISPVIEASSAAGDSPILPLTFVVPPTPEVSIVPMAEPLAVGGDASPLAKVLDRAMIDVRQAASMADEPINAGPGSLLTEGQRHALAAMTEAERGAFERKSPGMRADILRPFERGFEPRIFERLTRTQLVVPWFIAERRPTDRSTPGLVAAVAVGDPRLVIELAESLCRDLGGPGDRRRWGALHALAKQVLDRSVSAEDVLDAFRQAMGPRAENRGAVFTTALKRAGWRPQPLARK